MSIFHPTYLILAAGLFDAFVAGDLFNLYVGFEILLAASYVLLTLGGTGAAHPRRRHLHRRQPGLVDDLPRRHRLDLRRDRHGQHRAHRGAGARSCPPTCS